MNPWIGVDFDGTLAEYDHWRGPEHTGKPISMMVDRVKGWIATGMTVKIFTARISWSDGDEQRFNEAQVAKGAILEWCLKHIGQALEVTNMKDYDMIELYDDRCKQVIPNTGELLEQKYLDALATIIQQNEDRLKLARSC